MFDILDKAGDIFFSPVVQMILTALLAAVWVGWKKYGTFYKEIIDIGKKYNAVRKEGSPGGKKITDEEWAEIGKEVVDLIQAGLPLFKKGK